MRHKKFVGSALLILGTLAVFTFVGNCVAQGVVGPRAKTDPFEHDPRPPVEAKLQDSTRISVGLRRIIAEMPTETVSILIAISYNPSLEIRAKLETSELGLRIREMERQIVEAASGSVRGDAPEYLALFQKLDDANLVWRHELGIRLEAAFKPTQDEVSKLVESLGGETTSRYTVSNLIAARIEAQQIPKLLESPLIASVSDVPIMEASTGTIPTRNELQQLHRSSPAIRTKIGTFLLPLLSLGFAAWVILRRH